jgi:hypothetical protein
MWIVGSILGAGLAMGLGVLAWRAVSGRRRRHVREELQHARELFHRRREWLEADFLSLAATSGKPRTLAWNGCDFANEVAFARDRHTGQLCALVAVTICFSAIDPTCDDDILAGFPERSATSVFRFDGVRWTTDGRAVFNLNPSETIRHYSHELELVE